jgi:hypothetical protein
MCAAARTRLKKMKADDASKKADAKSAAPVERSPHAKEVREGARTAQQRPPPLLVSVTSRPSNSVAVVLLRSHMKPQSLTSWQRNTKSSTGASSPSRAGPPSSLMTSTSCMAITCKPPRGTTPRSVPCGRRREGWTLKGVRDGMRGAIARCVVNTSVSCVSAWAFYNPSSFFTAGRRD